MTNRPLRALAFDVVELQELNVLHWRGAHIAPAAAPEPNSGQDLFLIDTCQRRVAVLQGRGAIALARREFPIDGALESFEGTDAYAFLLRFACGLESKLVAETEIFGQIKQAWREFSGRTSPLARQLSPWVQLLFQDVKAIRAQHLVHLGSASYGSLVRRLLGDEPVPQGPTLLLGAGQLAQSVAPWLRGSELWLYNRTPERAHELARELAKRWGERPVRVIDGGLEAELAAWRAASHVVACIPPDPQRDRARAAAWRERSQAGGRVIHLGLGEQAAAPWSELPELMSLGGLFDMLRSHSQQRARQLRLAHHACQEKAVLRSLAAGASHSHSWEDLAAFHNI
ncbi:MAG TPA: hypothetical protein VID71_06890 [Steroidobacteraceae bacterium]